MLCKLITNNIRRYTHTHTPSHNSKTYIKDPILNNKVLESKMDKIILQLEHIDLLVKCNYFVLVMPGLVWLFK
jgi:hypothetical protein